MVADDGCVKLLEEGGPTQSVLWPAGWTAEVTGADAVVQDPKGELTIRTAEDVELAGGYLTEDKYEEQPCASGAAWQVVGVMRVAK